MTCLHFLPVSRNEAQKSQTLKSCHLLHLQPVSSNEVIKTTLLVQIRLLLVSKNQDGAGHNAKLEALKWQTGDDGLKLGFDPQAAVSSEQKQILGKCFSPEEQPLIAARDTFVFSRCFCSRRNK